MKFLLVTLLCLCNLFASAQYTVIHEPVSGKPFLEYPKEKFRGSPLLFDDWQPATATDNKGNVYKNMMVNLNLVNNSAIFKGAKGVFYFQDALQEIAIEQGESIKYLFTETVHPLLPKGYARILGSEPMVIKIERKESRVTTDYNVHGSITEFLDAPLYYFIDNGNPIKIKLSNKDAQKVFSQKWDKIADFVKANDLSFKDEETWKRVLKAYPSL
jgi:hypothetical protein